MNAEKKVFSRLFKQEFKNSKIELAIGDDLKSLSSKVDSAYGKVNKELDEAFTPIRGIENLIDQIPRKIDGFANFSKLLQKMEISYQKEIQRYKELQQELGEKVPMPKTLIKAVKDLETYQRREQTLRDEINEFNKKSKKYN